MLSVPSKVKAICHPLINSVYLKTDCTPRGNEDVLVIDTKLHDSKRNHDEYDLELMELLTSLEELKISAEHKIGKFDRIDIRTH